MSNAQSILKQYWGHDQFRPMQQDIINAVLEKKDVLALLPTGGGKSICFQVPAMMMEGICIVISPLIALMKDQVENLSKKGIPALAVYSGMTFVEVKKTLQNAAFGNYKFLYVSPERLETNLFLEFLPSIHPCLIAVDESHCISQWGYDFRPSYLRIAKLREELPDTPVIALTASATKTVQDDICKKLTFGKHHVKFQQSFSRPNLSYSVFDPTAKQTKLLEILKTTNGSSVVYCKSRKQTQQIASFLIMHGINADFYHAGLNNQERAEKQEKWINNSIQSIVCTNAFGMGIDKPDVRTVVHYHIPECLENYYQEAGRAGRDGKRAYAVLLSHEHEIDELHKLNQLRFPDPLELKNIYMSVMNHLQVPAGIGEGQRFDFDIAVFSRAFKLNILSVNYALQTLSQQGFIEYTETSLKPSTAVFSCSKEDIHLTEKKHPYLEPLIKTLLRTYEGIFDFPASIHESMLAKSLHTTIDKIKQQLQILHQYSIIEYQPQSEKSTLTLLKNRMYKDNYQIDVKEYLLRKQLHAERIEAMINFVRDEYTCRSVMIGNYFNDNEIKPCGICDNCINKNKIKTDNTVVKKLSEAILKELKKNSLKLKDIESKFDRYEKTQITEVLRFLQSEKLVSNNDKGEFVKS